MRTRGRGAIFLVVLAALALLVVGIELGGLSGHRDSSSNKHNRAGAVVPRPEPQLVKPLSVEDALQTNQSIPIVRGALEAAPAFGGQGLVSDPVAHRSALDCLTAAVYYEASSESPAGQRAVAQVVLNRVRHPAFPSSVCAVVYQGSERETGCQFTFTCDGSLARRPSRASWARAREIATAALAGTVEPSVGMATHYHADWVVPYWSDSLDKIAVIGAHIFYRWQGYWGRRQAFSQRYSGQETLETPALPLLETMLGAASAEPSIAAEPPNPLSHLQADLLEAPTGRPREDDAPQKLQADEIRPALIIDEIEPGDAEVPAQ